MAACGKEPIRRLHGLRPGESVGHAMGVAYNKYENAGRDPGYRIRWIGCCFLPWEKVRKPDGRMKMTRVSRRYRRKLHSKLRSRASGCPTFPPRSVQGVQACTSTRFARHGQGICPQFSRQNLRCFRSRRLTGCAPETSWAKRRKRHPRAEPWALSY